MGRFFIGVGIVAAVAALLAWNFYYKPRRDAAQEQVAVEPAPRMERAPIAESEPEPAPAPQLPPEFIVAEPEPVAEPVVLPSLDDSDETIFAALTERFASDRIVGLLAPQSIVRKVVVTVDNLPRKTVSMKIRAVGPTPKRFAVTGGDKNLTLDPDNYARYANFLAALDAVAPAEAVDLYVTYYPLLQEAFEGLGYPEQQFHNRLVEVIDHLLETPDVDGPVRLERPHVLYRYADPDLESRSAGQKTLIRMGGENRKRTLDWLQRFRGELVARQIS